MAAEHADKEAPSGDRGVDVSFQGVRMHTTSIIRVFTRIMGTESQEDPHMQSLRFRERE